MLAESRVLWRLCAHISGTWPETAQIAVAWFVLCVCVSLWIVPGLYSASSWHCGFRGAGSLTWSLASVGGSHQEQVTSSWPLNCNQAMRGCWVPSLSLQCTFCPPFPYWGGVWGLSLERPPLDWLCDWNQLNPYYKIFMILAGVEISCLLSLLPTHLEWSDFFFGLSLLSMNGVQSQISQRKLLSLWTNSWWTSQEIKEISLGKEAFTGEILSWPLISMWKGGSLYVGCS